ncbi:MAG: cupin domain-containing protein [Verrucomicrobiaceae bacterium]
MNMDSIDFSSALTPEMIADLAYLTVSEGLGDHAPDFERWWETAGAEDRALYRSEVEAAAALILAASSPIDAPPLDLSLIEEEEKKEAVTLPEGFSHLRSDEGEWRELPVKGARVKELSSAEEDGFVTMILELDAGTQFPAHSHHGAEHVYLLDGDLVTDGREMSPGDFLRACADTHHSGLYSHGGCHALIITAQRNYPKRSIKLYDKLAKSVRRGFGLLKK